MPKLTLRDVIETLGPAVLAAPSCKPRDPVERALLKRIGDPVVGREDDSLTKVAGERATRANAVGNK